MHGVNGVFHALMIAGALNIHALAQIAAAEFLQNPVAFGQRKQNSVQGSIKRFDQRTVLALMPRSISTLLQMPFHRRRSHLIDFVQHLLQVFHAQLQALVEHVLVGAYPDIGAQIPLTDALQMLRRHLNIVRHRLEGGGQLPHFVFGPAAFKLQLYIALGHTVGGIYKLLQRIADAPRREHAQTHGNDHCRYDQNDHIAGSILHGSHIGFIFQGRLFHLALGQAIKGFI